MARNEKTSNAAVIAVILLVIAIAANFIVARQFKGTPESAPMSGCWTEGSEPAQALRDYVAKVTDPSDKENFIPEEEEEELAPAA